MVRAATIVCALALAACSSEAGEPSGGGLYDSGSRLHAVLLDGGDGAVAFRGWFDTQLDIECVFQTAQDGSLRCLPAPSRRGFYADPQCTQAAVVVPRCDAT